jgi:hypothetical protein
MLTGMAKAPGRPAPADDPSPETDPGIGIKKIPAPASIQPVLIGFVLATLIGAITLATFWSH